MTAITEGRVTWTFKAGWAASKYDDWAHYKNQFQKCAGGSKAVDVVAQDPAADLTLWLIEAKDFTTEERDPEKEDLWLEVGKKARDTLAGLVATAIYASDASEKALAAAFLRAQRLRVVLHLEQPTTNSKLFPQSFDPADLQIKLKQVLKPIDAHPKVVDHTTAGLPWGAAWTP